MTAKDHSKLLGILFLIHGGLNALALFSVSFVFGGLGISFFASPRRGSEDVSAGAVMIVIFVVFLAAALAFLIPAFLAGFGLLKQKTNIRVWAIIAAILSLFNFPLGTALGVYALWFVFGDEGKRYFDGNINFQNPPPPNGWQ